ncbi:hypothetical protein ABFS82_08G204600 [Erythranthe guttata]
MFFFFSFYEMRQVLLNINCSPTISQSPDGDYDKFILGANNSLYPNQTLSDGDTLISPSQIFELGFFSPGASKSSFLGIWHKATPDIIIWVANRKNPIIESHGFLILSNDGLLILNTSRSSLIWSSNISGPVSSPVLQLLDNGNLALVEDSTTDKSNYIWQSFDYPCDTRVPGLKLMQNPDTGVEKYLTSWKSAEDPSPGDFIYRIENRGFSQMVIRKGSKKVYRSGAWNFNGDFFTGVNQFPEPSWNVKTVFEKGMLISISDPYNESYVTRMTITSTGFVQRYLMNDKRDSWRLMYEVPGDYCDNYGRCGPNGICRMHENPECECLKGFVPKSLNEWSVFDWSGGCVRSAPLDCEKEDGFLKMEGVKFADPLIFIENSSMGLSECRDECLKNCNCTAYADQYRSDVSSGCFMWLGDLIDLKLFGADFSTVPYIYIRVPISELGGNTTDWKKKTNATPEKVIFIAIGSVFAVLVLGLLFACMLLRMRRKRQDLKRKREELGLPLYALATIAAATNNFSVENLIGEGGFGPVYKGNLSGEQVIAVKRMSRNSRQGTEEFKTEVILIAKLQHRNLVRILGCCIQGEEKMLVYEYMHNKSLDYFIFDQERSVLLTWPKRFDIIMGIARGLLYLHHDSRLKVIHRDLKTSNILLDEGLNAKISDFGLARMLEGDETTSRTKRIVGTYGYMAPEYAFDGKFSIKSDVYSMGVVILEIVSGKRNRGFKIPAYYSNLLEQAFLLWKENRELELMDPCYKDSFDESQVKRCIQVGLLCVQKQAQERPVMPTVLLMLSTDDTKFPPPNEPGFFSGSCSNTAPIIASECKEASIGVITMTQEQGR